MMPDSSELTRLRSDMEDYLMPDTCNLLTLTQTSDGQGGFTDAWGTPAAGVDVECRLDATKGVESVSGAAVQPYHSYVLTLPHGTTITEAYRVEVGDYTFNVISVDPGKSWSACVRAYLEIV